MKYLLLLIAIVPFLLSAQPAGVTGQTGFGTATDIENQVEGLPPDSKAVYDYIDGLDLSTGASGTGAQAALYLSASEALIITSGTALDVDTYSQVTGTTLKDFTYTGGSLRYDGTENIEVKVDVVFSVTSSVNDITYSAYIGKNSAIDTKSEVTHKMGTGANVVSGSISYVVALATNDTIDLYFDVDSNATLTVQQSLLIVHEISGDVRGDSISVNGSAVVDPNFANTGDISFVNISNVVTGNVNTGSIGSSELEDDLNAVDEFLFPVEIIVSLSDETSDLTTGTKKEIKAPFAFTVTDVKAYVNTAPTGAALIVDVNEAGVSIFSTGITIDATEDDSDDATTQPVLSDTSIAANAKLTFDVDQIGSIESGDGLKVQILGTR